MVFLLITTISLQAIPITKTDSDQGVPLRKNSLLSVDDWSEQDLISFAKKLLGVKYKYGEANPSRGFDCSGFVHYVFGRFGITLPRSSSAIGKTGQNVPLSDAKAGDIILFTGTNPARRTIGHVGIVLSNNDKALRFIHASSGKAKAVTETALEGSYKNRFMKVIRVI
ncbi:Cell wall-associated hydrolase, NlpC family [Parapedobacter koreensis]|uniref:Cell wall-associated hydrolase, NlpC family n=2 Tax=Parapedobacter koreensis TaxID=332977 RepID=A0A1H7EUZ5_9SPHI|nr:Cell wall-associated hydrolase, NlpC family [Parapedobacter koreensis]